MDRWEYWVRLRPCFAMQGNQQHSATSKADQIMAKYRPIAPKPPLQTTSSLGKPASDSTFSTLDFLSTFNTTHNSNGRHNGSGIGYKRKASDRLGIPIHSPSVLKKPRGVPSLGTPVSVNQDILFSRVQVDGQIPMSPAKGLEANYFNGSSVFDERCGRSDEWVSVKMVVESIGEVGVGNLRSKVDDVSVGTVAETHCGCGFADSFAFSIAGEEEKNDLVTLPLLPQTPQLQNVSSASSHNEGSAASNNHASSHKEGIPLRLFGRDLGHREVGSCQISSNESLKLDKVVPIVGLSFI